MGPRCPQRRFSKKHFPLLPQVYSPRPVVHGVHQQPPGPTSPTSPSSPMPSEIPSMFLSSQPPFPTPRNFHTLFFPTHSSLHLRRDPAHSLLFDVEKGPRSELRSYLWYWSTSSCLIIISNSTQSSYYIILVSLRTLITSIESLNHHRGHQDITKYFPQESFSKVDEC